MKIANVYFHPINKNNLNDASKIAGKLLETLISKENISLEKEIPLKVHPGEPGNITFIKPDNFQGIIDYLNGKDINTYYIETNTVTGRRTNASSHLQVARKHGFTRIPFVVADGEDGEDCIDVSVDGCDHFKTCKIGKKLAKQKQIIVLSHFKGHIDSGFGGAIKMLGIGFASRRGKMIQHCQDCKDDQTTINWEKDRLVHGQEFRERTVDYAKAAVNGRNYIYITFAMNLVENCDCDSQPMEKVYEDLGIFASTDPVAIDKAVFDMLWEREGKKPFQGDDVFPYAEKIGLGSRNYKVVRL